MPNRLATETSPYLLQHKDNPVDWYPWGEGALAKAKAEDKPIFLSIGYAACHWCHVMAHESFEDPALARILNEHFVNIKVDREERPDLDAIYMDAVVALTGQGGWPMSVFLTPDGTPFYGGTYFPPSPRHGMPGFEQVLLAVADAWKNRREEMLRGGRDVLNAVRQPGLAGAKVPGDFGPHVLADAVRALWGQFDWQRGGWGGAPKFPQPMVIEFLLAYHYHTRESLALEMATKTLDAMARGGLYDQLGGGFHRYSVDAHWLVPHFEKMLYDNAGLARAYTHAWLVTRNPEYRRVAEETLDYVLREMTDPAGGFYGSQDADSEGEEGKFYVWTAEAIEGVLGRNAPLFMDAYGVTPQGNFEGKNILHAGLGLEALARKHSMTEDDARARLAQARAALFEARSRRVPPGRDDKALSAWNGLMLTAFADAARAFDRADYLQAAERNARFLLGELRTGDGRMRRAWRQGLARTTGYLEDHAHLAAGLLSLYQVSFDPHWFDAARALAEAILQHFPDPAGGFFDTPDDHEALVTRPQSWQDNALPSGNAMAASVLVRLGAFTGETRYAEAAEATLRRISRAAAQHPTAFAHGLSAMSFVVHGAKEVALIGNRDSQDLRALIGVAFERYRPDQVVAVRAPEEASPIPLLAGRDTRDHRATAYVCRHFTCDMPVTEPDDLRRLLEGAASGG